MLDQAIDTTTPSGRLLFHVRAAIAEFERDLIRDRVIAGLRRARAQGVQLGRPRRRSLIALTSGSLPRFPTRSTRLTIAHSSGRRGRSRHLAVLGKENRQTVVRAFIRATLEAVPAARRNSMDANTRPGYVLGVVGKAGHPIHLVNAFESPLRPADGKGLLAVSVVALKAEYQRLNTTWALKETELASSSIPDKSLSQFLHEVVPHVD